MPRQLTAKHKAAMQRGRRKAAAARRAGAAKRVEAFRKWVRVDAACWSDYRQGKITQAQWEKQKPKPPAIPDDTDFAIARGDADA